MVEALHQQFHDVRPDPRIATGQAVGANEHGRSRDLGRGGRTGATVEEAQQVFLERGTLVAVDLPGVAVTESGGDAVDRDARVHQLELDLDGGFHPPDRIGRNADVTSMRATCDGDHIGQGKPVAVEKQV